ncbi:SIR2 family protein (plasmid) [Sinorhizobium sp. M103]|uniref:SIR2 family protein n=1 Tax=Sinorhizobium sp. M103 TaxID=2976821 RepID=UPI0023D8B68B|nr:SIR2 family protein [Sinorhizobium sp. M103]WEJ08557.1 SIR2 family protein [Sinorhizobium sp. M103]
MDIETIAKVAQRCFASIPTVVLGSGASMPHGLPGMKALSQYLNSSVHPKGSTEEEKWSAVSQALDRGEHLEAALEGLNLPASLLHKIVGSTWNCVNEKDAELYRRLYADPFAYPLGELLAKLFHSSANSVDVVTTNYDRVVEYACNSAGLLFQTGFAPGYLQKWDAGNKITFRSGHKEARIVKIWKVHGSLDWFQTADERVIGLPVFTLPDSGVTPLIVTPGLEQVREDFGRSVPDDDQRRRHRSQARRGFPLHWVRLPRQAHSSEDHRAMPGKECSDRGAGAGADRRGEKLPAVEGRQQLSRHRTGRRGQPSLYSGIPGGSGRGVTRPLVDERIQQADFLGGLNWES